VSYLLSDGAEASAWRLRATTVRASKVGTTARSQCEDYIADLRKRDQKFDVVADEPRGIAGTDSHLVYLGVPLEAGGRGIMGMLVVPNAPDSYLVFSLLIVDSEFARARSLLDRSFATIALRDDPHTARIVRAVEAWLHAPTTGDRTRALEEIDALRLRPAVAPAGPAEGAGSRAGGRA
jgi:hypothetical protein